MEDVRSFDGGPARRPRLTQGQGAADLKANAPAADPLLLTAIDCKEAWEHTRRSMLQTLWVEGSFEGSFLWMPRCSMVAHSGLLEARCVLLRPLLGLPGALGCMFDDLWVMLRGILKAILGFRNDQRRCFKIGPTRDSGGRGPRLREHAHLTAFGLFGAANYLVGGAPG